MPAKRTVLVTGQTSGYSTADAHVPFKTVVVRLWSDVATVTDGVDPSDLHAVIVIDDNAAQARFRLDLVGVSIGRETKRATIPETGTTPHAQVQGIETGLKDTMPAISATPSRTTVADPSRGGTHQRRGKGPWVPWDRVVDALPLTQVDANGVMVLDENMDPVEL